MKVTIYGCGYVGLVTGACLAEIGHDVMCIDIDAERVQRLLRGEIDIYEPGLPELVQQNVANNRLNFSTDYDLGVKFGIVQFIAVNTPPLADGAADLKNVYNVIDSIAARIDEYKLIVNKSTVPVGTSRIITQRLLNALTKKDKQVDFSVASNPEFLKEGMAVQDFLEPDRIIIGCDDTRAKDLLIELYQPFINDAPEKLISTSVASAELGKYAANSMLATRISFMNEMAYIAEKVNADIEEVKRCMQHDKRIGEYFLNAGCGFGGSCLPKDLLALQHTARQVGIEPMLIEAVENVNRTQRQVLFRKCQQYFSNNLTNRTIALWGLAFKPGTNDIRQASSLYLLQDLWNAGATVQAYDPIANDAIRAEFSARDDLILCDSALACCEGADALIVVTEWDEFINFPLNQAAEALNQRVMFDGRNIYEPEQLIQQGWEYFAIGRQNDSTKRLPWPKGLEKEVVESL